MTDKEKKVFRQKTDWKSVAPQEKRKEKKLAALRAEQEEEAEEDDDTDEFSDGDGSDGDDSGDGGDESQDELHRIFPSNIPINFVMNMKGFMTKLIYKYHLQIIHTQ